MAGMLQYRRTCLEENSSGDTSIYRHYLNPLITSPHVFLPDIFLVSNTVRAEPDSLVALLLITLSPILFPKIWWYISFYPHNNCMRIKFVSQLNRDLSPHPLLIVLHGPFSSILCHFHLSSGVVMWLLQKQFNWLTRGQEPSTCAITSHII